MTDFNVNVAGGTSQWNPSAQLAVQNNYYGQAAPVREPDLTGTVVILGAGVDTSAGFPTPGSLVAKINEWLATGEGQSVDATLRKHLKGLRFSYSRFVDDTIDRLCHDVDRERDIISSHITLELEQNGRLEEKDRKMGRLIIRLFDNINKVKVGATIDEETERLIREVTGETPTDDTIIDFSHVVYTKTFDEIIRYILRQSLKDTENPILRHVYVNLLDIGQLLARYFYGFFTDRPGYIKTYLYIAWTLWAYLVHEEQERAAACGTVRGPVSVYDRLRGKEHVQVVTLNYTTPASAASPSAIYFNGNLTDYVDIENKNDLHVDDILTLDLPTFFEDRLSRELSLEGNRMAIPIPSFMPPLRLKPVISSRYVATWYHTAEAIGRAERILVLGHSLHGGDAFLNDMLRANRRAEIIVVERDLEAACRDVCTIFQQPVGRYTPIMVQDHPARKYDNRITAVGSDLNDLDLTGWLG